MMLRALSLFFMLAVFAPLGAEAVEPSEVLADPAQEQRAREVGKGLRCVVCQNQSIDDSNAELARDMRVLVRDRIQAGDSNEQVMAYMVDRYGDFVLLDPPFKAATIVLWVGPGVIAVLGLFWVVMFYRRRMGEGADDGAPNTQAAPLTDEERRRLDTLLKDNDA